MNLAVIYANETFEIVGLRRLMTMWSSGRRALQDLLSLPAVRSFSLSPAQVSVSAHFSTNVILKLSVSICNCINSAVSMIRCTTFPNNAR